MPRKNIYFSEKALKLLPELAKEKGMNDSEYVNHLVIESAQENDSEYDALRAELERLTQVQKDNQEKIAVMVKKASKLLCQSGVKRRRKPNVYTLH